MSDNRYLYAGMQWKYTVSSEGGLKPPQKQGTTRWVQLNQPESGGSYQTRYSVTYASGTCWEFSAVSLYTFLSVGADPGDIMFEVITNAEIGDIRITFSKGSSGFDLHVTVENLTTNTTYLDLSYDILAFINWCRENSTSKVCCIALGKLSPAYGPSWNKELNCVLLFSKDCISGYTPLGEGNAVSTVFTFNADKTATGNSEALYYAFSGQVPDGSNQFPDPSGEMGGEGDHTYIDVDIDFPDIPSVDALASDMIALYQLDDAGLTNLGDFLWSDNFIDNIKKNYASPMENIIALRIMPVSIAGTPTNVRIGNLDSGVAGSRITTQYVDLDCGSVHINKMWGNQLDFAPATSCKIYLPYIGYREIDLDDASGGELHLKYRLDALTGELMAMIKVTQDDRYAHNSMEYFFEGNCSCALPLSGSDFLGMYGQLLAGGLTAGIGAATKNPLMMAGGISSILTAKPDYTRSGNISGVSGYMATQTPFLLMECQIPNMPGNTASVKGIRSSIYLSLATLTGLQIIEDWRPNTTLASVCTKEELDEIDKLLKEGVIF